MAANSATRIAPAATASAVCHEDGRRRTRRSNPAPASTAIPSTARTVNRDGTRTKLSPGSQYTSGHFQDLLKAQGIQCSMSRAGEVWDNSAMESFFSSMKTERIARKVYRTRDDVKADVFDYIERFYNPTRRHSTLGYVSPIEFEKAQRA